MITKEQEKNIINLSYFDKCQIFDILLKSLSLDGKKHMFNELVENMALSDVKKYAEINNIDKRQVYRLISNKRVEYLKIDNLKILITNI